jgi:Skp family chaperone for outer membrane proteins
LDRLRSDFNAKSKKLERMQQNMKKLEANYQKSKEGTEEEASRKSVEVREEEEEGEFRVAKRVLKTYQSSSQVLA